MNITVNKEIDRIYKLATALVSDAITRFRPQLLDAAFRHDTHTKHNARHADNFLSDFDIELHNYFRAALAKKLQTPFALVSEEADPELLNGSTPRYAIIVDPLDTSELAVRGLHGYTQLLVWSLELKSPVVAVVGDFFHQVAIYSAKQHESARQAQAVTLEGNAFALSPRNTARSDRLLVNSYSMRPRERFMRLSTEEALLDFLAESPLTDRHGEQQSGDYSRLGVDFGSVGFCHVASGGADAFIEIAKGFALWDILPGRFILECAGGSVRSPTGGSLEWPDIDLLIKSRDLTYLNSRQKFVAASNEALALELCSLTT